MRLLIFLLALLLTACGGSGDSNDSAATGRRPATSADITLLFMGNSHTSLNNLTGMVEEMVRLSRPGRTVASVEAPDWMFLDERLSDQPSISLLRSQNWSFVILQAQKYSTTGQFEYSTAEAEELVRMARQQQAVPIMFPEWPRRDVNESQRIYDVHVTIAQHEPVCVAPIPFAWDLASARYPTLVLHAPDGNHTNSSGAFLAASIIFATITGVSPLDLPPLPAQFSVDPTTQERLRAIADETVQMFPPRAYCPADPFP